MQKNIITLLIAALSLTGMQTFAQKVAEQTPEVSDFTSVASAGPFNVHIKLDGTESLKLNVDEDAVNDLDIKVEDHTLKIGFKEGRGWNHKLSKADIYVTAKSLKALINSGSGSMKVDGTIDTQNFSAVLSGSGSISTDVKLNELHASVSGSGSIRMSGNTKDAKVVINGSGQLLGKDLDTRNTSAVISGSGNAYVQASELITARIVGSGSIIYSGDAKVESHTVGSGRITKTH